jgi:hypothetical protein
MNFLEKLFKKLGILNEDKNISITNVAVILFISICAFKSLFAGVEIETQYFSWKVEALDLNANLPLLFSFVNYGHRRKELKKQKENKNES